ncbi:MAG: hypothetical protein IJS90_06850, partial [Clostridia bacterium]|nr:hypothetical protein [Clostridia bacterium]
TRFEFINTKSYFRSAAHRAAKKEPDCSFYRIMLCIITCRFHLSALPWRHGVPRYPFFIFFYFSICGVSRYNAKRSFLHFSFIGYRLSFFIRCAAAPTSQYQQKKSPFRDALFFIKLLN